MARIFAVGARSRLRGAGWPGGRLYVSELGIRVRTTGALKIDVAVPREAVTGVWVGNGLYGKTLRISDAAGEMSHVAIQVPFRRKRILAELRRCGYPVRG